MIQTPNTAGLAETGLVSRPSLAHVSTVFVWRHGLGSVSAPSFRKPRLEIVFLSGISRPFGGRDRLIQFALQVPTQYQSARLGYLSAGRPPDHAR